jgi:hypothetical protein
MSRGDWIAPTGANRPADRSYKLAEAALDLLAGAFSESRSATDLPCGLNVSITLEV